jgi:hypothetical protein
MNRRDPLILIADPESVSSGLWPDRHNAQTPLWEVANNVQFAGGKAQRRVPNSLIPTVTGEVLPVTGIGQMQASNGVRWAWFAQGNKIYRWYGPAAELVGTLPVYNANQTSVADPTLIDFTVWGNWMVVNSAENGARIFKPGGPNTFNVLGGGAPQDAVQYLKKRNQLFAVGHGVNRRLVSFSDADAIETWGALPDNLAGELPLEELNSPIKAACHFGTSIAVFGENQLFEVKWIGQPFYYGQNKLLDGIGAIGKFAVCSDGRVLYGFSRNGMWKSDGLNYSYIDEVVVRDYFQNNINWDQSAKIVVRKNDVTGCIEVSFPTGESLTNNEAWAYDPRYGGWSPVPPFSAMENRALFSRPLVGQPDGKFELMMDNPAIAGPLLLETKALPVQRDNNALHLNAIVDEVEIFARVASKVQFQYGCAERPDGPWNWQNPIELVTDQVTYKLHTRISGTYHKLRFSSFTGVANWDMDLQGFALFGALDGYKRDKS